MQVRGIGLRRFQDIATTHMIEICILYLNSSNSASEVLQYLCIRLLHYYSEKRSINICIACVYTVVCNMLTFCIL